MKISEISYGKELKMWSNFKRYFDCFKEQICRGHVNI